MNCLMLQVPSNHLENFPVTLRNQVRSNFITFKTIFCYSNGRGKKVRGELVRKCSCLSLCISSLFTGCGLCGGGRRLYGQTFLNFTDHILNRTSLFNFTKTTQFLIADYIHFFSLLTSDPPTSTTHIRVLYTLLCILKKKTTE